MSKIIFKKRFSFLMILISLLTLCSGCYLKWEKIGEEIVYREVEWIAINNSKNLSYLSIKIKALENEFGVQYMKVGYQNREVQNITVNGRYYPNDNDEANDWSPEYALNNNVKRFSEVLFLAGGVAIGKKAIIELYGKRYHSIFNRN